MSMYQIEDLVEESVRVLCCSSPVGPQLWSDINAMYGFQENFDCSFTHLRLYPELVKVGYLTHIEPKEHPLYEEYRKEFEQLMQEDFDYVPGPEGGFWCGTIENGNGETFTVNKICCEYGSPLWELLVEKGMITGEAAQPPLPADPYGTIYRILNSVYFLESMYLHEHWFVYFPIFRTLVGEETKPSDELKELLHQELFQTEIYRAVKAKPYLEPLDEYDYDEFEKEWYAPYFAWVEKSETPVGRIMEEMTKAYGEGDYRKTRDLAVKGRELDKEEQEFYYFWSYAVIMQNASETSPYNVDDIRQAIRILKMKIEQSGETENMSIIYFHLTLSHLMLGEFSQASEAVDKAAEVFKVYPLLEDFYNHLRLMCLKKYVK